MKLDYTVSAEDYRLFNRYNVLHSAAGKMLLRFVRILIPVIFLWGAFRACMTDGAAPSVAIPVFAFFGIVLELLSKKYVTAFTGFYVRLLMKKNACYYSPEGTLFFEEDCIRDVNAKGEVKVLYPAVEKVGVTPEAVYIYFAPEAAIIVSAHLFNGDPRGFVEFLKTKIAPEKFPI